MKEQDKDMQQEPAPAPPTWYDDMAEMQADDAHLQTLYWDLLSHLLSQKGCLVDASPLRQVHAYPSRTCTYTINKQRIFVRMRDESGNRYADCVVRHVLLHEIAHVLNRFSTGHDDRFDTVMGLVAGCTQGHCPYDVPHGFNPCTG